jgi:hypothetical protein
LILNKEKIRLKYGNLGVPRNIELWCCAYMSALNKVDLFQKCLPYKCKIIDDGKNYGCFELDEKGDIIRLSDVYPEYRCYADTYEEAIELYNESVQKRINVLNDIIKLTQKDFI